MGVHSSWIFSELRRVARVVWVLEKSEIFNLNSEVIERPFHTSHNLTVAGAGNILHHSLR